MGSKHSSESFAQMTATSSEAATGSSEETDCPTRVVDDGVASQSDRFMCNPRYGIHLCTYIQSDRWCFCALWNAILHRLPQKRLFVRSGNHSGQSGASHFLRLFPWVSSCAIWSQAAEIKFVGFGSSVQFAVGRPVFEPTSRTVILGDTRSLKSFRAPCLSPESIATEKR